MACLLAFITKIEYLPAFFISAEERVVEAEVVSCSTIDNEEPDALEFHLRIHSHIYVRLESNNLTRIEQVQASVDKDKAIVRLQVRGISSF